MTDDSLHHIKTTCPWCGKLNTVVAPADGEASHPPTDNDVSMCFGCGEVSVFTNEKLRKPTEQETIEIFTDPEVKQARDVWLRTKS